MVFLGVYRAIYDYEPQSEGELSIKDGDLLFVLEKDVDGDWWRAKRKATEGEEEEPEGLIPSNYIEEAPPLHYAVTLYDYSRQSDEEISFSERTTLQIYDQTDPDWVLVGFNGEFGFAPANYIEIEGTLGSAPVLPSRSAPADHIPGEDSSGFSSPAASPMQTPAAALAGLIQQRTGGNASVMSPPRASTYTPDASDEEDAPPSLPTRPQISSPGGLDKALPQPPEVMASRGARDHYDSAAAAGGFHIYHIHEMISHMGRNRKMPTALGINVTTGIITIAPESEGHQQEWSADRLTHYSLEGKHVFVELVRPSKSLDFHAGNKETASEIVSALGELAGAARAEGLREVLAISNGAGGQKKGRMLYEFMAQGDDEVTVAVDDEVVVLDDSASDEWWKVRRLKNGKEGVVPSSYVEITGAASAPSAPIASAGSYSINQNRQEEERLTREAIRSAPPQEPVQSHKTGRRKDSKAAGSSKPNKSKLRTWTDRSGSFRVDAEFLGIKDGKIHLHKTNGVKIAVPTSKMSTEDIEYVERATGLSLDDEKPEEDRHPVPSQPARGISSQQTGRAGAAIQQPEGPRTDWFDFFLAAGVAPQICERYAMVFERDQMSEDSLQDVNAGVLRTLGLKEGDILRVMKHLDTKYGRSRPALGSSESTNGDGLFSGPDGGLKNNTGKGRPAPPVETNNTVDPRAFDQSNLKKDQPVDGATATPLASARPRTTGFEDDAWDNKPSSIPPAPPAPAQPQRPAITGAMSELSLLTPALQPTPAPQPVRSQSTQPLQLQPTGADPSFFNQLAQPSQNPPRQRPQPTGQMPNQSSMLPPPPTRAMSTSAIQPNTFQSPQQLRPQMTGIGMANQGPSMNDLANQRMQMYQQQTGYGMGYQQQQQPNGNVLMPQQTGYPPQNFMQPLQQQQTGYPLPGQNFMQPLQPQQTGFMPQQQQQQSYLTAQPTGSPFADSARAPFVPQQTGFVQPQPSYLINQPTGINSYMPLMPQRTGFISNTNGFGQPAQQLQPMQPQSQSAMQIQSQMQGGGQGQGQTMQPLLPQKTGPPPPIRFGVQNSAKKLTPQMTGRRANLAQATPQNPFGF